MNNRATMIEPEKIHRIQYREFVGLGQVGQGRVLRLIQESTL
jgi:hypothetical protein